MQAGSPSAYSAFTVNRHHTSIKQACECEIILFELMDNQAGTQFRFEPGCLGRHDITGIGNIAFECSFTVPKGGSVKEAEEVIATLEIRKEGEKYPAELIPVRLSEIYQINESYEWVVSTVKEELKKDFQGVEDD